MGGKREEWRIITIFQAVRDPNITDLFLADKKQSSF